VIGRLAMSPARDHHVPDHRGPAKVLEDQLQPLALLEMEATLLDVGHVVADQVHPGAVPAVLGARGQQFGQHLGGVPVRQPFDGPHVRFVQAVPLGLGMVGPDRMPVGLGGQHVQADRILPQVVGVHAVDHLRRDQHRHGPLPLDVRGEAVQQPFRSPVAPHLGQLAQVLHRILALPQGAFPVLPGHRAVARPAGPIRLDELAAGRVGVGLSDQGAFRGGLCGHSLGSILKVGEPGRGEGPARRGRIPTGRRHLGHGLKPAICGGRPA